MSLAVDYGKPIIVYSPSPELVRHFDISVTRARTLEEVETFLGLALGVTRSSIGGSQ